MNTEIEPFNGLDPIPRQGHCDVFSKALIRLNDIVDKFNIEEFDTSGLPISVSITGNDTIVVQVGSDERGFYDRCEAAQYINRRIDFYLQRKNQNV